MHTIRRICLAVMALFLFVAGAAALDLPVKKVGGRECYVYKVKKNETVYGVAKHLNLSPEAIIEYNPDALRGLKKNMQLVFPLDVFGPTVETEIVEQDTLVVVPEPEPVRPLTSSTIAVMLPFGLDKSEPSKLNNLCLDFYKGFLIGADTLCNRGGDMIEIRAFDTENIGSIAELLQTDSFVARASVIIAPEGIDAIAQIGEAAAGRGNYVLNLFSIRDTVQQVNPFVVQANIPQQQMYVLAAEALETQFEGFRPLILRNTAGRNEKDAFVNFVVGRYRERGIEPLSIDYEGTLHAGVLNELPVAAGERYVVIPSSGSLSDFNKMAYVLSNWREKVVAMAIENTDINVVPAVEIFGYPDWTAFRGEALEMLHRLGATIYSRFLDNFTGFEATEFSSAFRRCYGEPMIESVPTQALLGFDAANCIIKNLRANDGAFDPSYPTEYRGVQSTFRFERSGEGFANSALYIIRFAPGGRQEDRVL